MRSFLRLALSLFAVTVALAAARVPAHADAGTIHDYFRGMDQLLPAVDAWQVDLDGHLSAVAAKPELACGDEFAALLRRGHGLAEDLRGTGELAPSMLGAKHAAALVGLDRVVAGAELVAASCDGAGHVAGVGEIEGGAAAYDRATRVLRYYTARLR